MRVRKLHLKNIGPFEDAEIEFKPSGNTQEIHILTGPNGSGKTTLLQALAVFFGSPSKNLEALLKRMRADNSSKIRVTVEDDKWEDSLTFSKTRARLSGSSIGIAEAFEGNNPLLNLAAKSKKENWFAFAYSGYRVIGSYPVNAIQEITNDPLNDALIFDKAPKDSFVINQWIANNISSRALEKEKNNKKQADKYASAIATLEKVISEIVGYKIEFDLKTSPLSLVLCANQTELDFDALPDGIRSAISWMGDVLWRLDKLSGSNLEGWQKDRPFNEQRIFLFLDEIEVHLHPAWQRKVLPAVKKLFPNATIFLTTHSPFIVNSIDGAWVYELKIKDGKAYLGEVTESNSGRSYQSVLRNVFDIDDDFGGQAQVDLDRFYELRNAILQGDKVNESAFLKLAKKLALQGVELQNIIIFELRQLNRIKNKSYEI